MSSPPAGSVDARLLRDVAAGDEAALHSLSERHSSGLFLRLLRGCGDPGSGQRRTPGRVRRGLAGFRELAGRVQQVLDASA